MSGADEQVLQKALQRGAARHFGSRVQLQRFEPLSGGASATTWAFDAIVGDVITPLILQIAAGDRFAGALRKFDQAAVQQAAFEHGVPTPRVCWALEASDGIGEGYVSERIGGQTLGRRIVRDASLAAARAAMPAQCGEILARIHDMDPSAVDFLPDSGPQSQLESIVARHRAYGQRLPVFELAIRWLQRNIRTAHRKAVVHGDFRTGNLIVTESGIAAVLDWELAHVGDPMEDLGWLCMNAWRFGQVDAPVGGFGTREALYASYEQATGTRIDSAAVRYWEVYGTFKWGVICQYFAFQHLNGDVRSLERAAIGRRVAETELDLLDLIEPGACT